MRIEAHAAEGELHHIGTADEDGTGRAQSGNGCGVLFRLDGEDLGAGTRGVAGDVEEVFQGNRKAIDCRAAHARLSQPVAMVGLCAGALGIHLEEGAFSLAVRRGDTRERLLDKLATRSAPGVELAR